MMLSLAILNFWKSRVDSRVFAASFFNLKFSTMFELMLISGGLVLVWWIRNRPSKQQSNIDNDWHDEVNGW